MEHGESDPRSALFSFGVLTDVQYADQDDHNERHFRHALNVVDDAVACWKYRCPTKPAFVIHAGDLIDVGNRGNLTAVSALDKVATRLSQVDGGLVCLIGNHELLNLPRTELRSYGH